MAAQRSADTTNSRAQQMEARLAVFHAEKAEAFVALLIS